MNEDYIYKKTHPYAILTHMKLYVIFIVLSVLQQIFLKPQGIIEIIGSLGINALYVFSILFYTIYLYRGFTYRIDERGISVKSSVLIKKYFTLPYDKIQTVTIRRDIISAIFGAVKISADTAAGSGKKYDAEGFFSKKRAKNMLNIISKDNEEKNIYRSNIVNIILMSVFRSNPITGLLFIIPVIYQTGKIIGSEMTERIVKGSLDIRNSLFTVYFSPAVSALIAVIMMCWMLSVLVFFLRYARFRSCRIGDFIKASRGILNKSIIFTKISGISAITIDRTFLMSILGIYSSGFYVIGSEKLKGDKSILIAPEKEDKIKNNIFLLTDINTDEIRSVYTEKNTLWSYIYLPLFLIMMSTSLIAVDFMFGKAGEILRVAMILCIILFIWWTVFRIFAHKNSHIGLCNNSFSICCYKRLTLKKYIIPYDKIQYIGMTQNIFQRRKGTCNIKVYMYSEKKSVHIARHINKSAAEKLLSDVIRLEYKM